MLIFWSVPAQAVPARLHGKRIVPVEFQGTRRAHRRRHRRDRRRGRPVADAVSAESAPEGVVHTVRDVTVSDGWKSCATTSSPSSRTNCGCR